MRIAWIGLGKLGLPCAVAAALRGHAVAGYDVNPAAMSYGPRPYREAGPDGTGSFDAELAQMQGDGLVFAGSPREAVTDAEIVFLAIQTPHLPEFEGITPLPGDRADFDYGYLRDAVDSIAPHLTTGQVVSVVSTVLPGTTRREVMPRLPQGVAFAYTPSFIAMGTTMRDYLDPEFALIGTDDDDARTALGSYFEQLAGGAPLQLVSIESAELAKVAYNTAIGAKIAIANIVGEICEHTGADADEVTGVMKAAHRRLTSPAYMDAGMGDGGGCHPRDQIAMSWLARELQLSSDLFEDLMLAREGHARRLASMLLDAAEAGDAQREIWILGTAYKPGVAIEAGSHALLVDQLIAEQGAAAHTWDPHRDSSPPRFHGPAAILVGCAHPECFEVEVPEGSVVLDPFRRFPDRPGVEVRRLGGRAIRRIST